MRIKISAKNIIEDMNKVRDTVMQKKIAVFLLALLLALPLQRFNGKAAAGLTDTARETLSAEAGPADRTASGSSVVVTDLIGRETEVTPGSCRRVVCIGAGALRMYCYIGDISLLCGVEDIDNEALKNRPRMFDGIARPYMLAFGDRFTSLPSCGVGGPNAQSAEAEKILACGAELVISAYEDVEKADALQAQLGVPVITVAAGNDGVFDEKFFDSLRLLGRVFKREDRAEQLISFIEQEKQELRDRTETIPEEDRPAAYVCGLGNWGTTDHLYTAQQYSPFAAANVRNAAGGSEAGVRKIDAEKFEALGGSMDLMFIDAAAVKNIRPLYEADPALFDSCKACQNGEVYLQMACNVYYTNFETMLANTWYIAGTVYPEQFADIDITEKTDEITEAFLGVPLADEIFACPGSFGGYGKIDPAVFFSDGIG